MYDLKRALIKDLQTVFKDPLYKAPDKADGKTIHVFRNLPPLHDDPADDDDDFDYLAVYVSDGQRNSATEPEQMTAHIVCGVFDDSQDWAGADTLDLIIERILNHYDAAPLLDKQFRCTFPRNYTTVIDDDTFPYFFAVVSLTFERITPEEEDPYV
jgi:hypothetical protein|nr:MAG TPA_asm: hypothetical protein [Caudoviricetes sp.]